ncbi:MAG: NADH-quinone oxidoreductase subunit B 2 [Candidatus Poribacteria bacterium]|nr:MAG: NADH-quinone oxidoreductase subunit B 2 [Candidatus Poribacteria bacterium]
MPEKTGAFDFITTRVEAFLNWGRSNSLWPMPFGTACCAIEMMAALATKYDLARFGSEAIRFSPRQSDLLICAGRVSIKMIPVLKRIYDQMPEPKWVVSMGACASTGGVFNTYTLVQGIDQFIPVDVYVPGCPPRPEDLIDAVRYIQQMIRDGKKPRGSRTEPLFLEPGLQVPRLASAKALKG